MKHKGSCFIITGAVLLLAALGLSLYNGAAEYKADISAEELCLQLAEARAQPALPFSNPKEDKPTDSPPMDSSPMESLPAEDLQSYPDYVLNPNMDMPITEIDGSSYIGTLDIPALSRTLPVLNEWSYDGLRHAPGRYVGTVYQNNIVIAAHNYTAHFGVIKKLLPGDEVTFTDTKGNVFKYRVLGIEILKPREVEEMTTGDWDLTLFTCTYGGAKRVTVRCALTEAVPAWETFVKEE